MKIPLCNRCLKPAFLRVDARTVLCAECWNITWGIVTDRLKADFENSVSDGAPFSSRETEMEPSVTLVSAPSESHPSVSASSPDGNATVAAVQAPGPGAAAVADPFDDGIPEFLRRAG